MGQALTKEQKLEMVSKAIDAGFTVHVSNFNRSYDDAMKDIKNFNGLPVKYHYHSNTLEGTYVWITVNQDREFEEKFYASIHL